MSWIEIHAAVLKQLLPQLLSMHGDGHFGVSKLLCLFGDVCVRMYMCVCMFVSLFSLCVCAVDQFASVHPT